MSRHIRIPGTPSVQLWPDGSRPVTRDQKLDILEALVDHTKQPGYVEDLGKRTDAYFATLFPATLDDWVNACLRETWRDNHAGSPVEWDRVAREGGMTHIGRVELTRFET